MALNLLLTLLFIEAPRAQEPLRDPRCNLPMDRGRCMQFAVNWYYDRYSHRCRRFHYGGCEGNGNRFRTLEECSSACRYQAPTNRDRCFQPHDPGHCDSDIERWYFDKNKQQCVCSWWSGCGGNSNLYFSYNHCMFVCGEFAKHGPGIDEKYWGSRNRSRPVQPFYGGGRPPQQQQERPRSGYEQTEIDRSQQHYGYSVTQMTTMDYEELKRLHEEYYRRYPTTPASPQRSWSEQPSYRRDRDHSPASGYAEFRGSTSHLSSSQSRPYPYSSTFHASHTGGSQFKWSPFRARGERIYRYDTGPIKTTHPNGTVTIKRQVVYITENRQPTLTLHQRLPGLIAFAHITPPPPFSTMVPPLMRQRLKKLMKKKTPPRIISPPTTVIPISAQRRYSEHYSVARDNDTRRVTTTVTASPKVTNRLRHPSSQGSDESQRTSSITLMQATTHYPPRIRPQPKEVIVKPMINDASNRYLTTQGPTFRTEAELIDASRPVVISVSPKKIDFDEVLSIDSKIYDDYEDTFEDSIYANNVHSEHPTEATTTRASINPSSTMQTYHQVLNPIVSPPAGYHVNTPYDNNVRTDVKYPASSRVQNSQTLSLSPSRSSSVEGKPLPVHQTPASIAQSKTTVNSSQESRTRLPNNYKTATTQTTFLDEYTENVGMVALRN